MSFHPSFSFQLFRLLRLDLPISRMKTMIPIVTALALTSVCTFHSKFKTLAVLLGTSRVGTPAAFKVPFDCFTVDHDSFNSVEALFVVFLVFVKKVVALRYVVLVVKAACASTGWATKAAGCKTVTIKFKALWFLAIAGWFFSLFLQLFCLRNFNLHAGLNFEMDFFISSVFSRSLLFGFKLVLFLNWTVLLHFNILLSLLLFFFEILRNCV